MACFWCFTAKSSGKMLENADATFCWVEIVEGDWNNDILESKQQIQQIWWIEVTKLEYVADRNGWWGFSHKKNTGFYMILSQNCIIQTQGICRYWNSSLVGSSKLVSKWAGEVARGELGDYPLSREMSKTWPQDMHKNGEVTNKSSASWRVSKSEVKSDESAKCLFFKAQGTPST